MRPERRRFTNHWGSAQSSFCLSCESHDLPEFLQIDSAILITIHLSPYAG